MAGGGIALLARTGHADAYGMGRLFGYLIGMALFTTLVALFFWFVSGRRPKTGHVAFSIVLTLGLLGRLGQLSEKAENVRAFKHDLLESLDAMREETAAATNAAAARDAYNKHAATIQRRAAEMETSMTGSEKEVMEIVQDFIADNQARINAWMAALQTIENPSPWELGRLTDTARYEEVRGVFSRFIAATKTYRAYRRNMLTELERRFAAVGPGDSHVESALKGARETYAKQQPAQDKCLAAYEEYGKVAVALFDLLQETPTSWSFDEDVQIHAEEFRLAFNDMIDQLQKWEARINELNEEVLASL